uniref:putative nuclease HARBI1 n=1 Tax=Pristiophorus japonicus TaxID=55135 RepID=UPI00398F418E
MDLLGDQCFHRLRFRKDIIRQLCNFLQPDLQSQTWLRLALSIATKLTIALNFYTTGSFQSATVDISNISQFAAHHSIRQVTDAFYKRRDYISFPMSREKQLEWQTGFVRIAGFPRVQSTIDCTHVALRVPQNNPEMFRNHKGFHTLNVLVCNHHRKIMAVDVRYPGSNHDAFLLRQTGVPGVFVTLHAAQQAYNDAHSATRCIIEQCIRILKQRFRCLDRSGRVLQYSLKQVSLFVVVCCMLHNLAIMRAQPLEDEPPVPPEEEDEEEAPSGFAMPSIQSYHHHRQFLKIEENLLPL